MILSERITVSYPVIKLLHMTQDEKITQDKLYTLMQGLSYGIWERGDSCTPPSLPSRAGYLHTIRVWSGRENKEKEGKDVKKRVFRVLTCWGWKAKRVEFLTMCEYWEDTLSGREGVSPTTCSKGGITQEWRKELQDTKKTTKQVNISGQGFFFFVCVWMQELKVTNKTNKQNGCEVFFFYWEGDGSRSQNNKKIVMPRVIFFPQWRKHKQINK